MKSARCNLRAPYLVPAKDKTSHRTELFSGPRLLSADGEFTSSCPPSQHDFTSVQNAFGYLHCVWCRISKSPPQTTSFVFPRAKGTTNWQGPPPEGSEEHSVNGIFVPGHLVKGLPGFGSPFEGLRKWKKKFHCSQSDSEWSNDSGVHMAPVTSPSYSTMATD